MAKWRTSGRGAAFAINDLGQMVGQSDLQPVIWHDGVIYNLRELLADGYKDWRIGSAVGINNARQIAAGACRGIGFPIYVAVRLDPDEVPRRRQCRRQWSSTIPNSTTILCRHLIPKSRSLIRVRRRAGNGRADASTCGLRVTCRPAGVPLLRRFPFLFRVICRMRRGATRFPWLIEESPDVFNVRLPDPDTGACSPVICPSIVCAVRVPTPSSLHRSTGLSGDDMIARGYHAEGYGSPPRSPCACNSPPRKRPNSVRLRIHLPGYWVVRWRVAHDVALRLERDP
jgi:hypothetical protein